MRGEPPNPPEFVLGGMGAGGEGQNADLRRAGMLLAGAPFTLIGVAVIGLLGAAAVMLPAQFSIGLVVLLAAVSGGVLAIRHDLVGELIGAAFWLAFGIYQTMLNAAGVSITGFFYPFYAGLAGNLVIALMRERVRVDRWAFWLYGLFLLIVLSSLLGMQSPVDFPLIQRLLAYLFGFLILVQVGSRRGLNLFVIGATVCSTAVAIWVIERAARGGFDYRGDVGVDQNLVAFVVGLGIVVAIATTMWPQRHAPRRNLAMTLVWLALAVMFYGFLLLASRGMFIALTLTLVVLLVRIATVKARRVLAFILLLAVASTGLLLPGGSGLLERFQGESVETGGERLPAWQATAQAYTLGGFGEMAFGQGFRSSESVVQRRIGYTSVHNAYLQVLYEFGAVGLGLFLAIHVRLIALAWRSRTRIGAVGLAVVCFLLGANLTTDSPDGFLYWTALGFVAAIGVWAVRDRSAAIRDAPVFGPSSG